MATQIKVTLINNTTRDEKIISNDTLLKDVLVDNFDPSLGNVHLDGVPIQAADLRKSFADLGVTDKCRLAVIVKADNA